MTATFILSFDCEGKWGVADQLAGNHARALSSDRLRQAYSSILQLLGDFDIAATFAFVGAFAQSAAGFDRIRPDIEALVPHARSFLGPTLADIDRTGGDGWHGGDIVDAVASARVRHEIALHGVTHVPWTSVDSAFAEAEMRLFRRLEGAVLDSRTFVYPRNLVDHEDVLARHGFAGYRTARPGRSRLASLLAEFNIFEAPDRAVPKRDIVPIPPGFFLNWRSGVRKRVPARVTQMRVRRLLARAWRTDGVVHYWLHPENVVSAPATLDLIRMLASEVAAARDAGRCEVMTQLGYCERAESAR